MEFALFVATFLFVFLASFQQQNVVGGHYIAAACTSMGIAVVQYALITGVVASSWWGIVWMGFGGAAGVTLSMYVHRKYLRKKHA